MSAHLKYDSIQYKNGSVSKKADPISVEKALQISVNAKPFTVVMQTPGNELELALGLLFAEDVIKSKTNYQVDYSFDKKKVVEEINFKIDSKDIGDGYLSSRSLLSVSSCGICGKQSLEDLNVNEGEKLISNFKINKAFVFDLQKKLQEAQIIFPITGSTHGAALFNKEGELLSCYEDVGRHNALDKSIGHLIKNNQLKEVQILMFSGRISYEIVSKAFRSKIKLIIAISAPTSLAIDFAKEYGIHLIGFCRDNKFTAYTNPEYLD